MTSLIKYFTAKDTPSSGETNAIAEIEGYCRPPFDLMVENGNRDGSYGSPDGGREPDYVAGSPVPAMYAGVPVFNPSNPPYPLPATSTIVSDGQTYPLRTETLTVDVAAGEPTFDLPAGVALVADDEEITTTVSGSGNKAKFTVAGGVITAITLSS